MKIALILTILSVVSICSPNWISSSDNVYAFANLSHWQKNVVERGQNSVERKNGPLRSEEEFSPLMSSSLLGRFKSEKCKNHFINFVAALRNSSAWAIEMFDASSKLPFGLLTANTYQLGNYDQCIEVFSPENSLKGKYCLANLEFSPRKDKYQNLYGWKSPNEFSLEYDFHSSALEKFKVTEDLTKKKRNLFHSGICIPHTCDSEDAENFLDNLIKLKSIQFGYEVRVDVPERFCTTKEFKSLSREGKILGLVISGVVFCVVICTAWDRFKLSRQKPKSRLQMYVQVLSLSYNISKFSNHDSEGDLNVFNGMKCLSMILIIMGHRCMASFGGPFFNPQFLEKGYRRIPNVLLLNGTLIVDTFFLIGGFLTFLTLFGECKANNKLNIFKIYIYRWLRMAPAYMVMVFFNAHFLEHLGNGPLWRAKVGREAERCRKNWWTNFFFVNNYINSDSMCMFQSWYVACDMHFTLLAPFLVKIIANSSKWGLRLLISLIIGSLLLTFLITYHNKFDGVLRVYITTLEDLASSFSFNRVYIKSHHRATPYFCGMAAAYIFLKLKQSHHKFSARDAWIYSIMAAVGALSAICGAWIFYIPGRKYNTLENALYAPSHRLLWAVSMSWIALAGGTKAFGMLEPVLSQKLFTPFSKLSYSTFLVHGAIQLYTSSTLRVPEHMSLFKLYWMTCGDVILSYAFAFLLHIFFEAPIKGIQTLLFSKIVIKR